MPWLCGINGIVKDFSDEVILLHRDGEKWSENEVAQAMVFRGTNEPCWQRLLCYDADGCCFRELE